MNPKNSKGSLGKNFRLCWYMIVFNTELECLTEVESKS